MSSPSSQHFECHWRPSRLLFAFYLLVQSFALMAIALSGLPGWASLGCWLLCGVHAWYVLPKAILLSAEGAWRGLRHDEHGWQLWSAGQGWQPIQLLPDSLALPLIIVLRFRVPGRRFAGSVCVPCDALRQDQHRRLRVRLKFSRRRWAVPG
ncbi:MAG: hypothetical protein H2073_16690 [Pseudomonas sp.]|uniref:protein YgfX n=1 Tax=Stutzerimonas frequens TaxID=2968969 RepID=UPI000F7AF893|nr:protein YgfX [Stutzerimonas frequens]MBA4727627.1 hypothetical protein [Pseudomonas sp.]RRV68752.1 hypothetical protein EGI99_10950 [Stutzerimonas stutzeri]TDL96112.1 hypothetical protein EBP26_07185 [Stutzerimonas stutzeri ATCC 17588 = LMG 11199]MBK3917931.1 hypothetical protein [Stutzerimonas frequens]QTF58020.1 hypothetical protein J4H94_05660 [Stutzerimonas frequens]